MSPLTARRAARRQRCLLADGRRRPLCARATRPVRARGLVTSRPGSRAAGKLVEGDKRSTQSLKLGAELGGEQVARRLPGVVHERRVRARGDERAATCLPEAALRSGDEPLPETTLPRLLRAR